MCHSWAKVGKKYVSPDSLSYSPTEWERLQGHKEQRQRKIELLKGIYVSKNIACPDWQEGRDVFSLHWMYRRVQPTSKNTDLKLWPNAHLEPTSVITKAWSPNTSFPWESVRNAKFWTLPQTYGIRNSGERGRNFNGLSCWFWPWLTFEDHCSGDVSIRIDLETWPHW